MYGSRGGLDLLEGLFMGPPELLDEVSVARLFVLVRVVVEDVRGRVAHLAAVLLLEHEGHAERDRSGRGLVGGVALEGGQLDGRGGTAAEDVTRGGRGVRGRVEHLVCEISDHIKQILIIHGNGSNGFAYP